MAVNNRFMASLTPARTILLVWGGVILAGAFLLMLPFARLKPLSFLDALFTSTSATCVTGLMTVNVAETFTTFGQAVILLLIQLGGIGIMTVGTFLMLLLGSSVALNDWAVIRSSHAFSRELNLRSLVKGIVTLVFAVEIVGAAFLAFLWSGDMDTADAVFAALFHSVSAFCNAGISTFPNGLEGMEKEFMVDMVFTILIVVGGLGFITVTEMVTFLKRSGGKNRRFSLQSKVILLYTAILLGIGTASFFAFEFHNALQGRGLHEQLMASLFHSASARTAGFANVSISELQNPTIHIILLLMFIGGAPGSTAGGVKITTFAVMMAMAASRYGGHEKTNMFRRAVPEGTITHSIAIISLSIGILLVFTTLLLITESFSFSNAPVERGDFMDIVFEAVSALATVGLSMGITGELSPAGKGLVIILMFIGRLGPLAVVMAIKRRSRAADYQYPEENIMVG